MKVFAFDLLPYPENLDHLKQGATELPYPLPKRHFRPDVMGVLDETTLVPLTLVSIFENVS